MIKHESYLDQESIEALKSLIGKTFNHFYMPTLDYSEIRSGFTADSCSIGFGPKTWVVIQNKWLETEEDFTDYWLLSARKMEKPEGIDTYMDGVHEVIKKPSGITLAREKPLKLIRIYEDFADNEKTVSFDAVIEFEWQEGEPFYVMTPQDITDRLEFAIGRSSMREFLNRLKLRSEIK